MNENELAFATVSHLGAMIRSGATTPIRLAQFFLDRLERLGPQLNAVVTVTRERAMVEAHQAEEDLKNGLDRGPLHGIPYGVKDLFATAGAIPTTWGAAPFREQYFDFDAEVVSRLREAGAVLVAKLAMIELAGVTYEQPNASFTGPVYNPWNKEAWAGGSSSGSGAAVAAGLVPFAIGTETWGSIMCPSSFCGITGLRPTFGRVSREGAMELCRTLDKVGPMCRTAEDCEIVLECLSTPFADEVGSEWLELLRADHRPLRIGVLSGIYDFAQAEVLDNFDQTIVVLKDCGELVPLEMPDGCRHTGGTKYEADLPRRVFSNVANTVLNAEAQHSLRQFIKDGRAAELTAPESRVSEVFRELVPDAEYDEAMNLRSILVSELNTLFDNCDVVVSPTHVAVANPIEGKFSDYWRAPQSQAAPPVSALAAAANLAGWPAICVPNGFGERGLPTSLQITSQTNGERYCIELAKRFQSRTDWHERHPV